jgi:hypothetical protein
MTVPPPAPLHLGSWPGAAQPTPQPGWIPAVAASPTPVVSLGGAGHAGGPPFGGSSTAAPVPFVAVPCGPPAPTFAAAVQPTTVGAATTETPFTAMAVPAAGPSSHLEGPAEMHTLTGASNEAKTASEKADDPASTDAAAAAAEPNHRTMPSALPEGEQCEGPPTTSAAAAHLNPPEHVGLAPAPIEQAFTKAAAMQPAERGGDSDAGAEPGQDHDMQDVPAAAEAALEEKPVGHAVSPDEQSAVMGSVAKDGEALPAEDTRQASAGTARDEACHIPVEVADDAARQQGAPSEQMQEQCPSGGASVFDEPAAAVPVNDLPVADPPTASALEQEAALNLTPSPDGQSPREAEIPPISVAEAHAASGAETALDNACNIQAAEESSPQCSAHAVEEQLQQQPSAPRDVEEVPVIKAMAAVAEESDAPAPAPGGDEHPGNQSNLAAAAGDSLLGNVQEASGRPDSGQEPAAAEEDACQVPDPAEVAGEQRPGDAIPASERPTMGTSALVQGPSEGPGQLAVAVGKESLAEETASHLVDPVTGISSLSPAVNGARPAQNGGRSCSPKLIDPTKRLGPALPSTYGVPELPAALNPTVGDVPALPMQDPMEAELWGSLLVDSPSPCKIPPRPKWSQPANLWHRNGSG